MPRKIIMNTSSTGYFYPDEKVCIAKFYFGDNNEDYIEITRFKDKKEIEIRGFQSNAGTGALIIEPNSSNKVFIRFSEG